MKDHKLLWDKRGSHDLIVVFDTDSNFDLLDQQPNHPVNIVRECTTDCLDPNFINSDLPKVNLASISLGMLLKCNFSDKVLNKTLVEGHSSYKYLKWNDFISF